MTWAVDLGTAVTTWIREQAPAVPLVAYIAVDWVKELRVHGPHEGSEVGRTVFADEATGPLVLSLDDVEFPQVFIEVRVSEANRAITLLNVSTGLPE